MRFSFEEVLVNGGLEDIEELKGNLDGFHLVGEGGRLGLVQESMLVARAIGSVKKAIRETIVSMKMGEKLCRMYLDVTCKVAEGLQG